MGRHAVSGDPLARFEAEHAEALGELNRLETAVDALAANAEPGPQLAIVRAIHRFLSTTVRRHNENEEVALFPLLQPGPTPPFVEDHQTLRAMEASLAAALAGRDPSVAVRQPARSLIGLLRGHIMRENEVLFPLARERLGAAGLREVAARLGSD